MVEDIFKIGSMASGAMLYEASREFQVRSSLFFLFQLHGKFFYLILHGSMFEVITRLETLFVICASLSDNLRTTGVLKK